MSDLSVSPVPTEEEAAAIAAAIELAWPKPQTRARVPRSGWRFSGRWWTSGMPTRRRRPER